MLSRTVIYTLCVAGCLAILDPRSLLRAQRQRSFINRDRDPEENMTTPEIITHWGYPQETVKVTTDDGYILTMHRIPHGKKNKDTKGVIFMQHGLMGTSSNWITNLPNLAFGFMAADAGFDVWLGNVRGNTYALEHTTLDHTKPEFWKWTWDEHVKYDIPAMIDHVLDVTGQKDLYYVGHSQGTLMMFSKLAVDRDFNSKIRKFFALAPVGTVKYIQGLTQLLACDYYLEADLLLQLLGPMEFEGESEFVHQFAEYFCQNSENDQLCDNVMFMLGGPDSHQINESRTDVFLCDCPGGTSSVNMMHWLQMCRSGKQQMYDYGSASANTQHYGTATPPEYDIRNIKAETHLYYSTEDWLGDAKDVEEHLMPNIPKDVLVEAVELTDFNHFDFVFGSRAAGEVYAPIINTILADTKSRKH